MSDTPMTRDLALALLRDIKGHDYDEERAHVDADRVLLELINDDEITEAFNAIDKWYA